MTDQPPILEFDDNPTAIIEPSMWHNRIDGLPAAAVMTWMTDAHKRLISENPSRVVHRFTAESADVDIHQVDLAEGSVVAAISHVGAPVAGALYETLIAIGCSTLIAVGSSGGLVAEHPPGMVVVPDAAIRDEGVSYHYAPAERLAYPDAGLQTALRSSFADENIAAVTGDLWTTDAFFRETPAKVAARVDEGAIAVDMEASALATIASFRNVRHGHAVYMADTLHGDEWDPTELVERNTAFRYQLLLTAARTAAREG